MLRELAELRDKVQSLQKDLDNERRDRAHAQTHLAFAPVRNCSNEAAGNDLYLSQYA